MLNDLLKKSFLLPLIASWMISFMIFAPTANVLFSQPAETKAQESSLSAISDEVTYTAAIPVCEAIALTRQAATKLWGSTTDVPSADASAGGTTAGATMEICYKEWGDKIKNTIVEAITFAATTVMHQLLVDLTNEIVTCINTYNPETGDCEGGDSLLVVDFTSLLQNAADVAGARFLNNLTGINLCSTIPKISLQIALLPTTEFKERSACTLDKIVSNIESFQNDFRQGGWAAWEESAKPNNNAFGAWLTSTDAMLSEQFGAMQNAEKETTNGFKSTKKCISSSDETNYPASKLKADDTYCSASIVTTPSGTVEFSTNFAAMSPVRNLEGNLAGLYSKMGPFGTYLTAISNALLNKLTSTGLSALMSEITDSDTSSSNPYQDIIDSTSSATTDYSAAQSDQAYANSIVSTLSTLDSYITSSAKSTYSDIITVLTDIQTEQNKIMNDYWAQGITDSDTTSSITSGPTTVTATNGTQTTTTVYDISASKVGSMTIQQQTITDTTGVTTTTYSILSSKDQIDGIDGALTSYTDKYNSLLLTQSQIPGAQTQAQTAYNDITSYTNSWTGTSTDDAAQSTMNTSIANTVSYFQNSANWTPALASTTLSGIFTDITSVYNTTLSNISTEITNQTKSTYDTYLSDVQTIYSNLVSSQQQ